MHIRTVQVEEAPAFLELQKKLDEETSFMLLEPGERTDYTDQAAEWMKNVLERDNCTILVAVEGDELVGLLQLMGGSVRRNRHSAHIVVGIRQTHAGKGVGTQLFTAGESWARRHGIHRLELTVMVHNRAALALYRKMGFQQEGIKRDSLWVEQRYVDEYLMSKLLTN